MNKKFEKISIFAIYLVCFLIITEVIVNCCALHYLFPIKNASSFGYIAKESQKTIVPLNKYKKRIYSQLALPYESIKSELKDKKLDLVFDNESKKYGYKDKKEKLVIAYNYIEAHEFSADSAIVAIIKDGKKKYGTIDKSGEWIIQPIYDFLCPFGKYYTRACVDESHCGVIDRYGNEVTHLTYKTDRLKSKIDTYSQTLCSIGANFNQISCNYFL